MNQEILNNIIEKEVRKSSITSKDIPDLDLYMDQIKIGRASSRERV